MTTTANGLAMGVCLALVMLGTACAPSARAQNHAMAQAVLQKAGDGSLVVDASTDDVAAIRHIPSGMVCDLPADGAFDFESFPQDADNHGAYCAAASNGAAATMLAVRFSTPTTLDRAFADGLAASVGAAAPRPWSGQPSDADKASPEGLPHFRIARFEATVHDEPSYLRVSMAEVGGWYLQQIVSAPIAKAAAAEAEAGKSWRRAMREFAANTSPEKASQSAPAAQ